MSGLNLHCCTSYSCIGVELHPLSQLHISLSRTVPIQYHWIDPLMESLRSKFKQRRPFTIRFQDLSFYVNDDRTRFGGLPYSGLFLRRLYFAREHSQSSKSIINVEEARSVYPFVKLLWRTRKLNWLLAKYKRLENNPLYGIVLFAHSR